MVNSLARHRLLHGKQWRPKQVMRAFIGALEAEMLIQADSGIHILEALEFNSYPPTTYHCLRVSSTSALRCEGSAGLNTNRDGVLCQGAPQARKKVARGSRRGSPAGVEVCSRAAPGSTPNRNLRAEGARRASPHVPVVDALEPGLKDRVKLTGC